ncbi:unnamed protein product [Prorocentrum cordatum]|uniref:NADH:flavin oxidoreductase/NADH oxidase N-terminal domain-containing protein n=1 Tax=Prorocentrum cordatum TaxID=2364126 RepID=A0ABN9PJQ7_9DINO|nr:unnamed protein product [Polarella glacialis]
MPVMGHGYLLEQFSSTRSNKTADEYGCPTFIERVRLLLDVCNEVRKKLGPAHIVAVKLGKATVNAHAIASGETQELLRALSRVPVDLVEVSAGGNYDDSAIILGNSTGEPLGQPFFLKLECQLEAHTSGSGLAIMVTGGFRATQAVEAALTDGGADLVGFAKPFILCLDVLRKISAGESFDMSVPFQSARWAARFGQLHLIRNHGLAMLAAGLDGAHYRHQLERLSVNQPADPSFGGLPCGLWFLVWDILAAYGLRWMWWTLLRGA